MKDVITLFGLLILLPVVFNVMASTSSSPRSERIGVALLAVVGLLTAAIALLRVLGDPLPSIWWKDWLFGAVLATAAWTIWDVSRLHRHFGSSAVMSATEVAKGLLLSQKSTDAMWAAWARSLPASAWLKNRDGAMLCINHDYERRYGKIPVAYVGHEDGAVWSFEVSEQYRMNDKIVLVNATPMVVEEPAPLWSDPDRKAKFLKFPVLGHNGEIIGVGGIELNPVSYTIKDIYHE